MLQKQVLKRSRRQRGNVTLIFALSGLAGAIAIGGTVEVTRVVDGRAKMQSSLDAAALAAAGMPNGTPNAEREAVANKVFATNIAALNGVLPNSAVATPDFALSDRVTLSGEIKLETILGRDMFGGFHTLRLSSTAQKATAGTAAVPGTSPAPNCPAQPDPIDAPAQTVSPPITTTTPGTTSPAAKGCIWALGQGNVNGAITFNSGNQMNASTCQMHVQSTDNDSVFHNSGNNVIVDKLYTKGRVNQNSPTGSNFVSYAGALALADPYASGLPQLAETYCMLGTNWTSFDGPNVTLNPGTYCGGINFNSGVTNVTLNPGVYHIKADWNINGAVVNATGVTLYFPGDANFQLNANTRLNLSAPTSGATAGLAMYEKYGLGQGTRAIDARGGMNIKGIIYFPTKQLNFNSGNQVTSNELQILGRVIHFNDSDFNLSPYTGPLPTGVTLPGGGAGTTTSVPGAPPVSSGSGLLINGSFENPVMAVGTEAFFSSIPGWTSTKRFELHNSYFTGWMPGGYGTDGVQYGEIERDMSQTVTLDAGKTYRLSMDYRYGHAGNGNDKIFEAKWGGLLLGRYDTDANIPWRRVFFPIVGSGQPVVFKLAQAQGGDDEFGPFVDRIRIEEDNSLTPPPAGCAGGPPALPPSPGTPAVAPTPLRIIR